MLYHEQYHLKRNQAQAYTKKCIHLSHFYWDFGIGTWDSYGNASECAFPYYNNFDLSELVVAPLSIFYVFMYLYPCSCAVHAHFSSFFKANLLKCPTECFTGIFIFK
jgi:hypothetical protein